MVFLLISWKYPDLSYLNAISLMTELKLSFSPQIAVDMSGQLYLQLAEAHLTDDEVVLLRTTLNTKKAR